MSTTVLIGLDGATFTNLDPLMEDGHMPFLKDFIDRGFRAKLLSTPNPLTPPAWVSMATGRSPGHHGVYDFVRWEEREGVVYFTLNNSSDILCETIWSIASRQGLKVTHLNYPIMAPPKPINGLVIPSMVQWRHIKKNVYPKRVFDILNAIPDFNHEDWCSTYGDVVEMMHERALRPEYQEGWVTRNIRRDYQWFNILRQLMKNEPADLTAIVFDGVDKLQHLCWRFLDPDCMPTTSLDWERRMRDYVLDYFRNLDTYIRDIVQLAGDQANVFIASDHGFGPTSYLFHVNVLLKKLGYLAWKEQEPHKLKEMSHEVSFVNLDWTKTSAYAGTPASNGVCIRAAGEPGQNKMTQTEYLAFREKLMQQLLDFRDPSTGEQIITQVQTREEAFPGPAMEKAPDLLLTLSDHSFVSVVNEEPIVLQRPFINGTHRPEGVFIAGGPMIRSGEVWDQYSILDVAPTLLYSLGLPIPNEFEGRMAKEAFRANYFKSHPIIFDEAEAGAESRLSPEKTASPYSFEEEKTILAQLRALGYIE